MAVAKTTPALLSTQTLGEYGRFRLESMRTRFDAVEWFLMDAESPDSKGLATVVAQGTEDHCREVAAR